MAEPVYEQVAEAVRARLATIVADGSRFWYTPFRVVRCRKVLATWLDASIEAAHFIFLTRGQDTVGEGVTNALKGLATFTAVIARKDERAEFNPLAEDVNLGVIEDTILSRAIDDIRNILFDEPTLSGLVWNVSEDVTTAEIIEDAPAGWLMATLTFTVEYDYQKG